MTTTTKNTKSANSGRKSRKVAAISAGIVVIGLGATYTLATWNDSEWVWGGADGDPGVGTSSFNVQQDASSPYVDPGTFGDFETNPGDELMFSAGALELSPGDSVYAPVALRTEAGSVAGDVTLQGAVAASGITVNDDDNYLWDAVRVSVYTADGNTPPGTCDEDFDGSDWGAALISDVALGTVASSAQFLDANAGSTQHYCFQITLPETPTGDFTDVNDLQGLTIAPAWEFAAVSD